MERKANRMTPSLPFVGGGVKTFHVKNGGDSIEAADSKHHLVYYLEKTGGERCNHDLKQVLILQYNKLNQNSKCEIHVH